MPAELNFGTAANTTKHELVWRSEDRVSPIQSIGIGQHFVSHQNEKPISDTTLYHHVGRIIHRIPSHRTFHIFHTITSGFDTPILVGPVGSPCLNIHHLSRSRCQSQRPARFSAMAGLHHKDHWWMNDWFMGWRASEDLNLFFFCYFLGETKKLCDQSRRAKMGLKLGHWIAIRSDLEVYFDGFRWIAAVYPSICLKQSRKHQGQKALLFCNSNLTHFAAAMAALRRMVFTPTTGPGAGHVVRCSV